jgi:hypothetical protein
MARPVPPLALLGLLSLAACQRVPDPVDPFDVDDTDTDTDGTDDPTSGGPSGDEGGFGPVYACEPGDPFACPMGQKCTALSDGGPQNKYDCVPDDGALLPGDDCTPAPGTGQDQCAAGHACLTSKPDDEQGTCVELCNADDDCDGDKCEESPFTLTAFCAGSCDPLVPDCVDGRVCRQSDDRFVCGMSVDDTDIGIDGDPCDSINLRGCAEGYACMPGALIPGCASSACCTVVCDLGGGDEQCSAPALCKSLFTGPAPGFESTGACFVPA